VFLSVFYPTSSAGSLGYRRFGYRIRCGMTQRNHVIADLIRNLENRRKTGYRIKRGMIQRNRNHSHPLCFFAIKAKWRSLRFGLDCFQRRREKTGQVNSYVFCSVAKTLESPKKVAPPPMVAQLSHRHCHNFCCSGNAHHRFRVSKNAAMPRLASRARRM